MTLKNLEDYHKLKTPNAQMLALRCARREIELMIKQLEQDTVLCKCGYLMYKKDFKRSAIMTPDCYGELTVASKSCPCCGKWIEVYCGEDE